MKKKVALLLVLLSSLAMAQQNALVIQQTFSAATTYPVSTGLPVAGYTNHTLTWSQVGSTTITGCLVQVDSSPTGTGSWTAAGVIASQACNSSGTITITSSTASYIRINVTAITAGTVKVTYSAVNGALARGGSGMTWPLTSGIPVCTGTPCSAWGTTLPAPDGNAAHFLDGLGAWVAPSGGSSPTTVGITQWNGSAWGTSYYNAGNAAPRLLPTFLPTETTPAALSDSLGVDTQGWIGVLPDGTLIMVYQTRAYPNSFANASMRTSTDQGQTWSAITNILTGNATTIYACCDGMVTNTGRIIIAYRETISGVVQGIYSIYSDDNGTTWSAPVQVTSSTTQTIYAGGTIIGNGYLLIPVYAEGATNTSYIYISQNNGASWGSAIAVASSATLDYSEGSYAYLGGSTILGMIRCDCATYTMRQYLSTDNGTTWTAQNGLYIDSEGNSPWVSTFMGLNGRRVVELDYQQRSTSQEIVEYGYAADLISNGSAGWQSASLQVVGTFPFCGNSSADNGYPSVIHPYDSPFGIGNYYQYNTAGCPSAGGTSKIFYTVPAGNLYPLNAEFGTQITIGGNATHGYAANDVSTMPVLGGGNLGGGYNTVNGCYNINYHPAVCAFGVSNVYVGDIYSNPTLRTGAYNTFLGGPGNGIPQSGNFNTGVGSFVLGSLSSGGRNTAIGYAALNTVTTGSNNIAIGYGSQLKAATDNSEIVLGGPGQGSYTSQLGTPGTTVETFISGITHTGSVCTVDSVTGPIALTSSGTVVPFCGWSEPWNGFPVQVLAWSCQGTYSVSTTLDTLSIGMNTSAGLTSETGNASINSTLTGTSTQNSVTSTSTGNQNILTGVSVSGVSNLPFSTNGTVTLTGQALTFSITATITGSSPTAQINPGTSCVLQ